MPLSGLKHTVGRRPAAHDFVTLLGWKYGFDIVEFSTATFDEKAQQGIRARAAITQDQIEDGLKQYAIEARKRPGINTTPARAPPRECTRGDPVYPQSPDAPYWTP